MSSEHSENVTFPRLAAVVTNTIAFKGPQKIWSTSKFAPCSLEMLYGPDKAVKRVKKSLHVLKKRTKLLQEVIQVQLDALSSRDNFV